LVVVKGTKIAAIKSIDDLKSYKLGAQLGTTSYDYIVGKIKPSQKPAVFDTNAAAVAAIKNKQIDGLVVDFPTALYVTAVQVPNSLIVGRFPSGGTQEHFGLVFDKGNPLVGCVNEALSKLNGDGTLQRLQEQWISKAGGAPVLK